MLSALGRLGVFLAASSGVGRSQQPGDDGAQRRAAAYELRRLHQLMQEFVDAWNAFVAEYVQRGTFNVKKARVVRDAWLRLERAGAFPK